MKEKDDLLDALGQSIRENYDTKDSYSMVNRGFLKTEIGVTLPDGSEEIVPIRTWTCKEGDHYLDVVPYVVGKGNPNPRLRPGTKNYVLVVLVHENVGTNNSSVVCPSRNYGQACPICEKQRALKDSGREWDDPEVKALEPKKKTVYNVICSDSDEEWNKGVQVWVTAHWNFERHILQLAKDSRTGEYIPFPHPEVGKTIAFKREGKSITDTKYLGHKFVDRDYVLAPDILEQAYCLEDLLGNTSYEEIRGMFYAGDLQPEAKTVSPEKARTNVSPTRRQEPATNRPAANSSRVVVPNESVGGVAVCPVPGGKIGLDIDKLPECPNCSVWDDCLVAAEHLETSGTATIPPTTAVPPAAKPPSRLHSGRSPRGTQK